jgi:hypothetical protein
MASNRAAIGRAREGEGLCWFASYQVRSGGSPGNRTLNLRIKSPFQGSFATCPFTSYPCSKPLFAWTGMDSDTPRWPFLATRSLHAMQRGPQRLGRVAEGRVPLGTRDWRLLPSAAGSISHLHRKPLEV